MFRKYLFLFFLKIKYFDFFKNMSDLLLEKEDETPESSQQLSLKVNAQTENIPHQKIIYFNLTLFQIL